MTKAELRNKIDEFFSNIENSTVEEQGFQGNITIKNTENNNDLLLKLKNGQIGVNEISPSLLVDELFYNEVIQIMEDKVFSYFDNITANIPQGSKRMVELKSVFAGKLNQFKAVMKQKRNSALGLKNNKVKTAMADNSLYDEERPINKEEINNIYSKWVESYNISKDNKN